MSSLAPQAICIVGAAGRTGAHLVAAALLDLALATSPRHVTVGINGSKPSKSR